MALPLRFSVVRFWQAERAEISVSPLPLRSSVVTSAWNVSPPRAISWSFSSEAAPLMAQFGSALESAFKASSVMGTPLMLSVVRDDME